MQLLKIVMYGAGNPLVSHKTKGSISSGPAPFSKMNTIHQHYVKFLAYCLAENAEMPDVASMDWRGLYAFSQQQAIVGIVLRG